MRQGHKKISTWKCVTQLGISELVITLYFMQFTVPEYKLLTATLAQHPSISEKLTKPSDNCQVLTQKQGSYALVELKSAVEKQTFDLESAEASVHG